MRTTFYPRLGSKYDLWFARVAGAGLANGFYNYFHAAILAQQHNGDLITPPWLSIKLGTILRAERSKRFYFGLFNSYAGELTGLRKLMAMMRPSHEVFVGADTLPIIQENALNKVQCTRFTFKGLYEHREHIRERLLAMINTPIAPSPHWGQEAYIAIHVRLGDYSIAKNVKHISAATSNTRIPLAWYEQLITLLRARYPEIPIRIISDGHDAELASLVARGATLYRSGSDIDDLLALASARLLVGSYSTYSYWASFLGNAPSIWLDAQPRCEQPTDANIPIAFVPLDAEDYTLPTLI